MWISDLWLKTPAGKPLITEWSLTYKNPSRLTDYLITTSVIILGSRNSRVIITRKLSDEGLLIKNEWRLVSFPSKKCVSHGGFLDWNQYL